PARQILAGEEVERPQWLAFPGAIGAVVAVAVLGVGIAVQGDEKQGGAAVEAEGLPVRQGGEVVGVDGGGVEAGGPVGGGVRGAVGCGGEQEEGGGEAVHAVVLGAAVRIGVPIVAGPSGGRKGQPPAITAGGPAPR